MQAQTKLIGPFRQMLTMDHLSLRGSLGGKMEILREAGILVSHGTIIRTGPFAQLSKEAGRSVTVEETEKDLTVLPGLIDAHTHICFAGLRAADYAQRLEGVSYLQIASEGGGIRRTVSETRKASFETLLKNTEKRAVRLTKLGITTAEVKSGYGLNLEDELKMLRVINKANENLPIDLLPTCLAAHMKPDDFKGDPTAYLEWIIERLLPLVLKEQLAKRVDIFVEKEAFGEKEAVGFLQKAKAMGFDITVHADQFTTGGSRTAIATGACSADHLEASGDEEIRALAASKVSAVVLPGASLGLGSAFAPARKLLDAGASLTIASDWNPGSAPMGDLLTQAAILGAYEKLSMAEIIAGITFRAAHALRLRNRGILKPGLIADLTAFPVADYREILYHQGQIKPVAVWKNGQLITSHE